MRSKITKCFSICTRSDIPSMPKRTNTSDSSKSAGPRESKVAKQSINESTKSKVYVYDGKVVKSKSEVRERDGYTEPLPKRDTDGVLLFSDAKEFRPNMTPKEVLHAGSFGGTYFRPIKSSITGLSYNKVWNELPQDWLQGVVR